mmetsp:Transcript_34609/g.66414  ORF Transcript_34609/g.66414 Transcript_34609/m.66414 type:complete len:287 (-) Transcript_34609:589-1449(-)
MPAMTAAPAVVGVRTVVGMSPAVFSVVVEEVVEHRVPVLVLGRRVVAAVCAVRVRRLRRGQRALHPALEAQLAVELQNPRHQPGKANNHHESRGQRDLPCEERPRVEAARQVEEAEACVEEVDDVAVLLPRLGEREAHRSLRPAQREARRQNRELHRKDHAADLKHHPRRRCEDPAHLDGHVRIWEQVGGGLDDDARGEAGDERRLRPHRDERLLEEDELLLGEKQERALQVSLEVLLVGEKHRLRSRAWRRPRSRTGQRCDSSAARRYAGHQPQRASTQPLELTT